MKLAYLGTPAIAVPPLRALVAAGHDIEVVITGPDTRRGRGKQTSPNPVKVAALELGLRVEHDVDVLHDCDVELGVVVAYGAILRPPLLAVMPFVNLHFSLLPLWRGAAPVERSILEGDVETGVCIMAIEEGLDTGGVFVCKRTPVGDKTLDDLWTELSNTGASMLVDWLPTAFDNGTLVEPEPQVGEPTYAAKLTAADRHVDLAEPVELQFARIRLGNAWTMVGDKRMKLLEARLDDNRLEFVQVQPEGKNPMAFDDWLRGATPEQREVFGR